MKNLLKDQAAGRVDPGLILFRFILCAGTLKSNSMPGVTWNRGEINNDVFDQGNQTRRKFTAGLHWGMIWFWLLVLVEY